MVSINKINFNISGDDENLNDYLYSWSELAARPNKVSIHGFFDSEKFIKYIESLESVQIYSHRDIIPNEDVSIINEKYFINISNDIFLSYTHLDKIHDESYVSDVVIFYNNGSKEKSDTIVNDISEFTIQHGDDVEIESSKIHILNLGVNGFEMERFDITRNFEDVEFYYEDNTLKKVKKVIKRINKENVGLTIFFGERGCGKTTLLSYISSKLDKNVIFIPCNLIENSINNFEFRRFLKQNPNSVIILDDVELYFNQIYSKSTFFTNNLLQLVDGFYANDLKVNIILSLNCSLSEIDRNIFDSNSLLDTIEVGKLSTKKVNELCEYLDKKNKIDGDLKLVEVIKKPIHRSTSVELGFK
jgi:ABC-type cobalamin/Fe3+-siderophores transport system ATPase subunit